MTRNGSMSKPLIFFIPAAILLRVFSASGFLRAKMFSPFSAQSMISRAGRHGLTFEPGNIEACDEAVFCRLWDGNGQVGSLDVSRFERQAMAACARDHRLGAERRKHLRAEKTAGRKNP